MYVCTKSVCAHLNLIAQGEQVLIMTDTTTDQNLLFIPTEILIEIILYLNARERVALGHSCRRLNSLVFGDKKLLRDLDFSKDGYLTSMSDLQQYFNNKTKYDHIRRIDVSDIYCTRPAQMLSYISKAKNLIEVNMTGVKFKNHEHFSQFLKPLEHLKKLSSDWLFNLKPGLFESLKERFNRLTHLSMTFSNAADKWMLFPALELCEELEELRMLQTSVYSTRHMACMQMTTRMKKLRLITYYGCDAQLVEDVVMKSLSDPEQWTLFETSDTGNKGYFHHEKKVQVSEELRDRVHIGIMCPPIGKHAVSGGWSLDLKSLLENVVCIAHHMNGDNVECSGKYKYPRTCLLRIEDTKLLLKNPRHRISYLNIVDDITPECDIRLVTSTFPSLTKLVLSRITKKDAPLGSETIHLESGFKRKRVAFEKQNEKGDSHSSFKMLVESTSQLKDLTICDGNLVGHDTWDLTALQFISGWRSLTKLYLANLPIRSGQFLVEIGKQCVNLEKLRLENLGARGACCYKNALLQMLPHCHNLKDFSIEQTNIGQVSHVICTLTDNTNLRRVRVKSLGIGNDVATNLIPPIVRLMRATRLILLVYEVEAMTQVGCDKLKSVLQRLKIDLDRPNFQFAVDRNISSEKIISQFSQLELVHKDLLLPHSYIDTVFRLNL